VFDDRALRIHSLLRMKRTEECPLYISLPKLKVTCHRTKLCQAKPLSSITMAKDNGSWKVTSLYSLQLVPTISYGDTWSTTATPVDIGIRYRENLHDNLVTEDVTYHCQLLWGNVNILHHSSIPTIPMSLTRSLHHGGCLRPSAHLTALRQ
jgi:hypothetical protein